MHIVDVKLENIKSHKNSSFHFERGTTAIMGENGAGKTTIIEAVAWALFDLLDYKKDDFVRRGQKKGSVMVTFESGLDERQYTVYRDTGTGYSVYDPALGAKIRDKKEDVTGFLHQHLGVDAGTDLELLFRSAIGVPQGTFTAIFLETAARRKETFERLLKVEEYREGAEKLRETSRFVDTRIAAVREKIARAEGELARFEAIETEHAETVKLTAELKIKVDEAETKAAAKREENLKFEADETAVKETQTSLDKLKAELATTEALLTQKETEVTTARAAAQILKTVAKDHDAHVSALAELKGLEGQRAERDGLLAEKLTAETAVIKTEAERDNLIDQLRRAEQAAGEIRRLMPLIRDQEAHEKKREILRNRLAQLKAFAEQLESIEKRLVALRDAFSRTSAELKEAEEKSASAPDAETLTKTEAELTRKLAQLQTNLEWDKKFQAEIENGLCPLLSAKCLNMAEGVSLNEYIADRSIEISAEIADAHKRQQEVAASLSGAREAGQFLKKIDVLKRRQEEIKDEGVKLRAEQDDAAKQVKDLPRIEKELGEAEKFLSELKSPRERVETLRRDAEAAPALKNSIEQAKRVLIEQTVRKTTLDGALAKFAELDAKWQKFSAERDRTEQAYRDHLANEMVARALPTVEAEMEKHRAAGIDLKHQADAAAGNFAEATKRYKAEKHHLVRTELLELEKHLAEAGARFSIAQQRQADLASQVDQLKEIRSQMQAEFVEKDRLEKVGEATKFIRDTLKEAAPRIAKLRIYQVANEANQLFREITGNPERSLKWGEDYAVLLEEGGYARPFQSLSGGEQMAAALSLRLALLKQLSDVRLAFFDEPTTNMDEIRRERLAEQISHITENHTFDQLFVISHDDTFEGYVDNVVTVGDVVDSNEAREKALEASQPSLLG